MKKGDFFIIAAVILLSLLPLAWFARGGGGGTVTVVCRGETVYTGPLSQDATIPVGGNVVEIANGRARMRSADCPDQLCVHAGAASALRPLVCLPNEITVTVSGEEEALDGIVH